MASSCITIFQKNTDYCIHSNHGCWVFGYYMLPKLTIVLLLLKVGYILRLELLKNGRKIEGFIGKWLLVWKLLAFYFMVSNFLWLYIEVFTWSVWGMELLLITEPTSDLESIRELTLKFSFVNIWINKLLKLLSWSMYGLCVFSNAYESVTLMCWQILTDTCTVS